ncbi:hypothetical protein CR513_51752, partial [Mucuna pruriens]
VCLHSTETKPDDLCRDHLGLVSAESNSARGRNESVLYTSNSTSFHFTPSYNRERCVLEKNNLGYLIPVKTTKTSLITYHFVFTCEKCQKVGVAISRRHEMPQ